MGDDVDAAYETGFVTQSEEVYSQLKFKNLHSFYDREAPDVRLTFALGLVLVIVMMIFWSNRYYEKKSFVPDGKLSYGTNVRAMISAAIDNDSPLYTIVKISAQSIMFLAGIQLDYQYAFIAMLIFFTVESCLDAFRTLLCVYEYDTPQDLVLTSSELKRGIDVTKNITQLHPTNVYEDLSRVRYVVFMVFGTQFLLIAFVVGVVTVCWFVSTHSDSLILVRWMTF